MKLARMKRSFHSLPITISVMAIFVLFLWATIRERGIQSPPSPRLRRTLLKKLMEHESHFVPANNPYLNVQCSPPLLKAADDDLVLWQMGAHSQPAEERCELPGFELCPCKWFSLLILTGTYLEFHITNTTSFYLALGNVRKSSLSPKEKPEVDERQLFTQPTRDRTPPSPPVSLLLQVAGQAFYFDQTGHDILAISSSFDRVKSYRVRVTYLGSAQADATLEFEGIWLDKGGYLIPGHANPLTGSRIGHMPASNTPVTPPQRHVEVISSLSYQTPEEAVHSWPLILASQFNNSHTIFPTSSSCLTPTCSSSSTLLSDLYFRAGPPGNSHFQDPYRFGPPYPSALILDVGLADFHTLLLGKPSSTALNHFITTFIEHYVNFITTIRSTAYPYNSAHNTHYQSTVPASASFTYNSAPSTLPIFLLTPFTPSSRLQRLLSHAISQTVNRLQKQGDKSTFWIDTAGWLAESDFTHSQLDYFLNLRPSAHLKISNYMTYHLCPYLSTPSIANASMASVVNGSAMRNSCPFNRHDNYLGNLYVPAEAGMSKMMQERKISLFRSFLGMEDVLI